MVHILSRREIERFSRSGGGSSGAGGGSVDISMLAGYATEAWCKENFVTVGFFDSIFQLYNDQDKISVNGEIPVDTSKMNIKAMFGFWTDFYISALGNGGQVGASIYLSTLADVNVQGVQSGQVLTWDSSTNKWIATTPASGVDMTAVWNALAANTSQQINASHLAEALNDYATQTWVLQQEYITANALVGLATETWCNQNFVTVGFFDSLFQLYNNQTKINVNGQLPVDTSKLNIKAMFGFWTNFYLSALGNGGQAGASIYLSTLADVNVQGVQSGQVLTWDGATNKWIATTPASGVDMTVVWNALAANTSQQINASHLSTALTGYATETWVGQQGYITSSALTGYATQTWVGQQGYITSSSLIGYATETWVGSNYLGIHGTADAADALATARSLWGQSFDGTSDVSGNMSGVGDIQCSAGSRIHGNGGALYVGNSNDANWVLISDMCSRQGDSYWKVYTNGSATFANVYSNGSVTALSDEREKNIIEHFEISLEMIAKAPIVSYTWKDTEKRGDAQHIGSIAQHWVRDLPELVPEVDGRYTMDYGRIALLSAITVARHTVNLESRIAELERRIS